jgi:hypothetical protein
VAVEVIAAATVVIVVAGKGVSGIRREAEAIPVWRPGTVISKTEIAIPIIVMMPSGVGVVSIVPIIVRVRGRH